MGSIKVQITTFYATIAANTKSGWWYWNHSSKDCVYTFSAVPWGGDNPPDKWYALEVTDVGSSHIAAPGGVPGEDRRVRFKVNNPNSFQVVYEIHMSTAFP